MLLIGKIIACRGLKGEVKIYPYTNHPEDFSRIKKVYLDEDESKVLTIKKHRINKNLIFAFFEGIDHINQAEELKNREIYLDDTEASNFLADDSYYYKDIIGVDVYDLDGNNLGKIDSVNTSTKQDLFLIKDENKEWYLPNVKEFVKEIDIDNNRMIVDLIEGLIDEN